MVDGLGNRLLLDSLALARLHTRYNKPLLEMVLLHYDVYVHMLSVYEYAASIFYYRQESLEGILERMKRLYTILGLDEKTVVKAAQLDATLTRKGVRIGQIDVLVAASAMVHNLSLVAEKPSLYKALESYGLRVIPLDRLFTWAEEKAREYM